MRIVERAAALITVLAMPAIALGLSRAAISLWEGLAASANADAGVALDYGLALAAASAGAAIAAYLALTGYAMVLGTLVAATTRRRGRSRSRRAIPRALASLAPSGWTRITATALGVTLSTGLAGPAYAADADPAPPMGPGWVEAPVAASLLDEVAPSESAPPSAEAPPTPEATPPSEAAPSQAPIDENAVDSSLLSVGWTSDVPAAAVGWAPASSPGASSAHESPAPQEAPSPQPIARETASPASISPSNAYVVQPGDSLWRIAESLLGSDASTADIAAAWPALYEANREAIGADPSLIHPGLALAIPAGLAS